MNKTAIFITFAVLAAIGIVGTAYMLLERPDATATFTGFVLQILAVVSLAAATFYGFGTQKKSLENQDEKLEKIEQQTNGRLSARDKEIERLTNVLIEKGIDPQPKGRYASDAPTQ